jgi:uncharacterized membrane protein YdjX (TVP38/TMEM64 family)
LFLCVVLLVIVAPFLAFGRQVETWYAEWKEHPPRPAVCAALVIGGLAVDIFLPVPSSGISTFGGWQLGTLGGTLASWVGMTLSAVVGFAVAYRWGWPFARLFTNEDDLERMRRANDRYGPMFLLMVRGVPVLAEASVLLVGITRLPWRRFLPPILVSNLVISLVYAAFGEFAAANERLPLAVGVAIAVPVLLAIAVRRKLSES